MRRTKIIATFGPSIADPEVLKEICEYADAIRINLAHGTWDESEEYNHVRNIQLIQKVSQELKKPVAILVDLKGNKIRIGGFKNHMIELENDSEIFTSGSGGIFRSGIPIGKTIADENIGFDTIKVKFHSDFSQLRLVKIVSFEEVKQND